jgi:(p)ppGpp synthase/HD superfamily hydrolase
MNLVEKALEIATKAHEGQFRRDKITPYISHPVAVSEIVNEWLQSNEKEIGEKLFNLIYYARQEALAFGLDYKQFTEMLEVISLLHDAAEDNKDFPVNYIIDKLKKYNDDIMFLNIARASLNALTHIEHDSYLDYILSVKHNRFAKIVKLADITHNISTRKDVNAGEAGKAKLAVDKYLLAKHILLND